MRPSRVLVFFQLPLSLLLLDSNTLAQNQERPALRAGSLSSELSLDGVLSEPAWASADSIQNLTTIEPKEGGVPAGQTIVKVLANSKEIVFGVLCHDSDPAGIVSFSKARDSELEEEDHIVLVLDTFQDGRSGYVFAVNPNGARVDGLVIAQGEKVNNNWDAVWEARTSRDGNGWSAEIRIPIKSIAFKKGGTSWGFNVQRHVQRLLETSRWSGAKRDYEISQTSQAGLLTDLPNFDLGLGLSIRPTLVADFNKPAPDASRKYDASPSLDMTKTLGSNLLASLTVNTDFAETEADVRQTNLTRFDLFFPEKRTFFLQGSDIFDDFGQGLGQDPGAGTNLVPFFSRRIGLFERGEGDFVEIPIDAGAKINGRVGNTNLGALAIRTRRQGDLQMPGATMGVLRVKQNVLKESSVGMIATVGDPSGRPSLTYQTSEFRDDKNLLVGIWGLRNDRSDLVGDKSAYGGKIAYPNDRWDLRLSGLHLGDGFDPSLGFVRRRGNILEGTAEFGPRPGGERIRQLFFGVKSFVAGDQNYRWESYDVEATPFEVQFESGESFEFIVQPQGERLVKPFEVGNAVIEPGKYEWLRYTVAGALAEKRKVSGEFSWSSGGFYQGNLKTIEAKMRLKPSATVITELGAERNLVDLPQGSFTEDVYGARLQVNISSDLQISSLMQYDNQSRSFGTNTRLRWTFRPLGDLFIVYNHNLQRSLTNRWQLDSNQLIVKFQYALRF
ncbi:MAG: hypothetical protein DMG06_19475 [Acidobacteria bacterium]|nr:MAG: hypothetical protein DMG06_19475 [Acidobacteriota bacterium]